VAEQVLQAISLSSLRKFLSVSERTFLSRSARFDMPTIHWMQWQSASSFKQCKRT